MMKSILSQRTFGELGLDNRAIFIAHPKIAETYSYIRDALFGNHILQQDVGPCQPPIIDTSAVIRTDPSDWMLLGNERDAFDEQIQERIGRLKKGLGYAGLHERLLVCVHAPRKQYDHDAFSVLEKSAETYDATHKLLVTDPLTHSEGIDPEGREDFEQRVRLLTHHDFFMHILSLQSSDPTELQREVTLKICELLGGSQFVKS